MLNTLTCALVCLAFVTNVTCLAVSTVGATHTKQLVSTKKSGGRQIVFSFEGASERHTLSQSTIQLQRKNRKVRLNLDFLKEGLRSTFLPIGYPDKTPPGYLKYSIWSWIQDLSTQLRSVLATQRILEGVGVGREGATALSALMNFLVRDGCGMAASLLFTSVASSNFSSDVKRWRLFADLMVDMGITLEVAATLVPRAFFLPMISVGNMCKSMCGVAAGACGGAINLHWSRGSDIADIQAKFGAQHTVTGSLGLVFAALFARSVSQLPPRTLWLLYGSLTVLHIYANMQCMKLIAFDSLNLSRFNIVALRFLDDSERTPLPCPRSAARKEPLIFFLSRTKRPHRGPIRLGASFNELAASMLDRDSTRLELLAKELERSGYVVHGNARNKVVVVFAQDAPPITQARAYFHAILLSRQIHALKSHQRKEQPDLLATAEAATFADVNAMWPDFERSCRAAGWDLSKTELRTLGYEVSSI